VGEIGFARGQRGGLGPRAGESLAGGAPAGPRSAAAFGETECLHGRLPARVLAAAQERAARLGLGANRILIAAGSIDEESYPRALGDDLGVAFEPLDDIPRALCPLDDARLVEFATYTAYCRSPPGARSTS
jgi:hypothetical protein